MNHEMGQGRTPLEKTFISLMLLACFHNSLTINISDHFLEFQTSGSVTLSPDES